MRYQGYFLGIALGAVLQTGLPTVARGIFGAGAGFRVGWRTGGALSFCSVGGAFIVAGGLGAGLSF